MTPDLIAAPLFRHEGPPGVPPRRRDDLPGPGGLRGRGRRRRHLHERQDQLQQGGRLLPALRDKRDLNILDLSKKNSRVCLNG